MLRFVIGEILPLALVVTISPLNIIPAILLLFTPKPLLNALSFLAGFAGGVAVVLGLFISLGGAVNLSTDSGHSTWAGILKIGLGVYLLFAAVKKFRGRPEGRPGRFAAEVDGWNRRIFLDEGARAGAALGALNPKNLVVGSGQCRRHLGGRAVHRPEVAAVPSTSWSLSSESSHPSW